MVGSGLTLIETEKWEDIRKKLYFPDDVDEFANSSKPLVDFTLAFLSEVLPRSKKPLKEGYIADVCRDGCVSPCSLIMSLIYIQRLAQISPAYLARTAPSDIFLAALVIASKYLQDEGESEALVNSEWAAIGQKSKSALDLLEKEFLSAIEWNLYVSINEYNLFTSLIQGRIAYMEAIKRGWWSYSDMVSHWETTNCTDSMINASIQTTKVFSGSFATYLLCVTAIVSASHVTMETKQPTPPTSVSLLDPEYVMSNNQSCPSCVVTMTENVTGLINDNSNRTPLYYALQEKGLMNCSTYTNHELSEYYTNESFDCNGIQDVPFYDKWKVSRRGTRVKGETLTIPWATPPIIIPAGTPNYSGVLLQSSLAYIKQWYADGGGRKTMSLLVYSLM